jgi:hypothetical protein
MKARPAKPKLNKMGQPENFGVEADSPALYTVSHKPKVIVGGNEPSPAKYYETRKKNAIKKVLTTEW